MTNYFFCRKKRKESKEDGGPNEMNNVRKEKATGRNDKINEIGLREEKDAAKRESMLDKPILGAHNFYAFFD